MPGGNAGHMPCDRGCRLGEAARVVASAATKQTARTEKRVLRSCSARISGRNTTVFIGLWRDFTRNTRFSCHQQYAAFGAHNSRRAFLPPANSQSAALQ